MRRVKSGQVGLHLYDRISVLKSMLLKTKKRGSFQKKKKKRGKKVKGQKKTKTGHMGEGKNNKTTRHFQSVVNLNSLPRFI